MKSLTSNQPSQRSQLEKLDAQVQRVVQWHRHQIQEVWEGRTSDAIQRVVSLTGEKHMDAVRRELDIFRAEEDRLDDEQLVRCDQTRQVLFGILSGGTITAIGVMMLLGSAFSRSICSRLSVLADNAGRLAQGKRLAPPVGGADEIADVDKAFRGMAATLEHSLEHLRQQAALLDQAYDAVFVWDWDGTIRHWHKGAETLYGFSTAEAVGTIRHNLLATRTPQEVEQMMQRLAQDHTWAGEEIHTTREGRHIPVDVRMVLMSRGEQRLVLETNQDTSDRKLAEQALRGSEEQFRALADNISQLAWMADENGWIFWYNKRWFEFTGTTHEEMQGWGWRQVHHPDHVDCVVERISRCFKTGEIWEDTFPLRSKDGEYRWFLSRAVPIHDDQGRVTRWCGTNTDITDRMQADAEPDHFFTHALDMFCIAGNDCYFKRLNPAFTATLGWSMKELLARPFLELVHPDDRASTLRCIDQQFVAGEPVLAFENRYLHKNGTWRVLAWKSVPVSAGLMYATARDVTAQREAEAEIRRLNEDLDRRVLSRTQELQAANASAMKERESRSRAQTAQRVSEERFQMMVNSVQDYAIIMLDATGHIVTWNAGAERIKGHCEQAVLGEHISLFYLPEDVTLGKPELNLKEAAENGRCEDLGWRVRKNGERFWANIVITSVRDASDTLLGFLKVTRDVTDRKIAQDRLQMQVVRLNLINDITEAIITQAIVDRENLQGIYHIVLSQLEEHMQMDFVVCCALASDASELQVTAIGPNSQPLSADLGVAISTICSVDSLGLGPCVKGDPVYVPDLAAIDAPLIQQLVRVGLRSLMAVPLGIRGETHGILLTARRKADGYSTLDCEFLKQLSNHVSLAGQHAKLYQDLKAAYDELRQSQMTVLQQERLRALGQMASGIAHDINNAISPIAVYADSLLEGDHNLTPTARKYLTTIAQAIDDVAQTVSRLRDFYRQQERQVALNAVILNPLVHQVLDLTRARWRDQAQARGLTIEIVTDLAAGLPTVMGIESDIRDALTNLVFNAVDAMPSGGILSVRTRPGTRAPVEERGILDAPTHVIVEVSDTGLGMSEETRQRCLEPFFTTKGERGTGLGLAMVYGAMQRHSGDIEIQSEPEEARPYACCFSFPRG